jgi:hypothetical protein
MNIQPQTVAIDRVLSLVRSQGMVETDPVDFVEFLLSGVQTRDLDQIADDIVCFVLRWDDLRQHVRDRLEVQRAYAEADYRVPAADQRRAAESIVAAIRAIVAGRFHDRIGVANVVQVDAADEQGITEAIRRFDRQVPRALPGTRQIEIEVK